MYEKRYNEVSPFLTVAHAYQWFFSRIFQKFTMIYLMTYVKLHISNWLHISILKSKW